MRLVSIAASICRASEGVILLEDLKSHGIPKFVQLFGRAQPLSLLDYLFVFDRIVEHGSQQQMLLHDPSFFNGLKSVHTHFIVLIQHRAYYQRIPKCKLQPLVL